MKSSLIKKENSGLPEWLVMKSQKEQESTNLLILKGTFPMYILEISPNSLSPESIPVVLKDQPFFVTVKSDLDRFGKLSKTHLMQLCNWYKKVKMQ
ncbi:hypothetical protein [Arundinibacter roseus]|uniref:Uncharacterized protein n=1 Tax=Arundinibacter roseus TaxID=2070510 RepID=A0A4R4JYK3_9BACT|nr:hypothetical protein [Arundinibacter roseus]TDB60017.1 hypothetical protein EZE20_21325 [Arundinibacter roseus]